MVSYHLQHQPKQPSLLALPNSSCSLLSILCDNAQLQCVNSGYPIDVEATNPLSGSVATLTACHC